MTKTTNDVGKQETKITEATAQSACNGLLSCPFCKSTDGYYDKNITAFTQYFNFAHEPIVASEIRHVKGGKRKYCTSCDKDITILIKQSKR